MLSIIVPVYRVEDYLRECLDSLLGQSFLDVEVVAVDDASPDGCAAILAEYAARDPRVKVVTLTKNGGLGAARNAGIAAATGDYVWFVDSDDWLTDGALAVVADRLQSTDPDVLIVGYERVFPDGRVEPEPIAERLRDLPEVFSLASHPVILNSLHISCNKVIRRQLLVHLDLNFALGWYEDVSFSHPLLIAAQRIGWLEHVCYGYRQREGAITRTEDSRHFDVFDQWERVFTFLDEHGGDRVLIFDRLMWHLLAVYVHAGRVPARQRREFFARMTDFFRRYRPDGYAYPSGVLGLKHVLVARGWFRTFERLRSGWVRRPRRSARADLLSQQGTMAG